MGFLGAPHGGGHYGEMKRVKTNFSYNGDFEPKGILVHIGKSIWTILQGVNILVSNRKFKIITSSAETNITNND